MIKGGLWKGYSLYELYEEASTPLAWHKELFDYAKHLDIAIFSTPFDETAVDFLENLGVSEYKVASFELTDLPLISYIARTKKPMIMSTGMASLEEIGDAVDVARKGGCPDLTLLHCISSYPAQAKDFNMRSMSILKERFDVNVGLSDHTLSNTVAILSVALGAHIIEKHMTLRRLDGGVDSAFSLEPQEFKSLCDDVRDAFEALGMESFERPVCEKENTVFRRSLYPVHDIQEGEIFTTHNLRRIRPGYSLSPKYYDDVLGSKATRDIQRGERLSQNDFKKSL